MDGLLSQLLRGRIDGRHLLRDRERRTLPLLLGMLRLDLLRLQLLRVGLLRVELLLLDLRLRGLSLIRGSRLRCAGRHDDVRLRRSARRCGLTRPLLGRDDRRFQSFSRGGHRWFHAFVACG
jgi:hypothetical protein